ncbi:hypothetical protein B296_00043511 [Ensete ventricosum]|uniref:Uncharacterized protein n=1 Tax=Ensete ventricosum TaxID=4639 RepID=A0A426Z2F8_ENSVE|nr:hypothetical protein B296_00043511 [Ensete ventricosum]
MDRTRDSGKSKRAGNKFLPLLLLPLLRSPSIGRRRLKSIADGRNRPSRSILAVPLGSGRFAYRQVRLTADGLIAR